MVAERWADPDWTQSFVGQIVVNTITIAPGSVADQCSITIQFKDGNLLAAGPVLLYAYLSETADGVSSFPLTHIPSGAFAAASPGLAIEDVIAKSMILMSTDATGAAAISLIDSGHHEYYVCFMTLFGLVTLSRKIVAGDYLAGITTTTVVTSSENPSFFGDNVTFTATVTGTGTPTGSVNFVIDGGAPINVALTAGVAQYATSALSIATHTVEGDYLATGAFENSSGTLAGGQVVNSSSPLLTGLQAYWPMETTAFLDSSGNNLTLTNVGGVTVAPGKVGNAAVLDDLVPSYLSHADAAPLRFSGDYTIALWFNQSHVSVASSQYILAKNGPAQSDYFTYRGNGRISFDQDEAEEVREDLTNDLGVWHFLVIWRDVANLVIGIQVDNGDPTTTPIASATPDTGQPFVIGHVNYTGQGNAGWGGLIDEVGMWNRVLTYDERSTLWNVGAGLTYPLPVTPSPLLTNLVAYWDMETTAFLDSSGNGHTLTNNNGVTVAPGIIGNGAVFNGTNSYLAAGVRLITTDVWTFSAWVKTTRNGSVAGAGNGIFYQGPNTLAAVSTKMLIFNFGLYMTYEIDGNYVNTADNALTANVLMHVVAVFNAGVGTLYINGVQAATKSGMVTNAPANNPFYLGFWDHNTDPNRFLSGMLDEVGLWSRALTAGEILALYNAGAGLAYPFS